MAFDAAQKRDTLIIHLSITGVPVIIDTTGPVISVPSISVQPISQTVCAGEQVIFSITSISTASLRYQWKKGKTTFNAIPGATSAACTLSTVSAADDGVLFSCVVSTGSDTSVTSALCTLTVNTRSTTPNAIATPQSVCLGGSVVLS